MSESRFSVISDEVSQDPAVVRRFVRDFGLGGFELRSMFGRAFKDLTSADVDAIRGLIRGEGWRVHGCATPVFKCEIGDAAAGKEHLELFRRSIEIAGALDCRLLRVFTFLRHDEPLTEEVLGRISERLFGLAELAAQAGMQLGIENESSCRIGSGAEMIELARVFSHPAAGWVWDPCNVLYVPGEEGPATGHYARFAGRVVHIHVKDAIRTPGAQSPARAVPVGDGEVSWATHFDQIGRSGYLGRLSLETHWRRRELDQTLLHLPAGAAFSAGGEEASRICMARLIELWESRPASGPKT